MKKFTALFLSCVFLFAAGCTKPKNDDLNSGDNNGDGTQNENRNDHDKANEMIEGRIITVTKSDGALVSFVIYSDAKDEYLMNVKSDFTDEAELGDNVSVFIEGEISETSPRQATALEIQTVSAFAGVPQPLDTYSVHGVNSTKLSETMGKSGYVFRRFTDYAECQNFLEDNYLTEKFNESARDIDITSLTDSFFALNNLYLFAMNESVSEMAENGSDFKNAVYIEGNTLYLKTVETTVDAPLPGASYRICLIPLSKDVEIADGVVLLERILKDNLGGNETDETKEGEEAGGENKTEENKENENGETGENKEKNPEKNGEETAEE